MSRGDRPTAARENAADAEISRLGSIAVGPGLAASSSAGGLALALDGPRGIWARIESGANPYAWTEVVPAPGGAWEDGTRAGTVAANAAWEVNGSDSIPAGAVVWLELGLFGENRFQATTC